MPVLKLISNTIELSEDIIDICHIFALNSIETNYKFYKNTRKQTSYPKIFSDIENGKIGEFAVSLLFTRSSYQCSLPDINVYPQKKKTFSADLNMGRYRLHIKTQTKESSDKYTHSWVFQSTDKLFTDNDKYDIFVGCSIDDNICTIKLIKPFKKLIFNQAKLNKFSWSKKIVYLDENI